MRGGIRHLLEGIALTGEPGIARLHFRETRLERRNTRRTLFLGQVGIIADIGQVAHDFQLDDRVQMGV